MGPEPIYVEPDVLLSEVAAGRIPPVYSYAGGNPIAYSDPTGRIIDTGDDAVLGYYIGELLRRNGKVGDGVRKMSLDSKNVFSIRQVNSLAMGQGWPGGSGNTVGVNHRGGTTYAIAVDFDAAKEYRGHTSIAPMTPESLLAHELGHQYSKAYEDQTYGVQVAPDAVIWRHDKVAIDWENEVAGDPKRPYVLRTSTGEVVRNAAARGQPPVHGVPRCSPVPMRCGP